jgi:hypothetical protein
MQFKQLVGGLAVATALTLALAPGHAQAVNLDFNMDGVHPAGASISYAAGAAPLVGTQISVDSVAGLQTPLNQGSILACTGCLLSFTTGNLISYDGVNNMYNFGGGGSISVVGTITLAGITNATILTGSFAQASVVATQNGFMVTIASFTDTKNAALLNYFGLPTNVPYAGNMNLSFSVAGGVTNGAAFRSTQVLSGDLTNTVPEPASVLLLGSGLAAMGLWGIKRRTRA